jgi:phospholipase/carboxylesterase
LDNPQDTTQIVIFDDWTIRLREPDGSGPHRLLLLLHGWTGDENVMWIFAPRLPKEALLVAPRGLHAAPEGGYSWHPGRVGAQARIEDFRPAAGALVHLLDRLKAGAPGLPAVDTQQVSLVGFSQGAALAYTIALLYPQRVERLAGLAGFLPEGAGPLVERRPLEGKALFVAHGTQDERVPVARARQAVQLLQQAGAQVTYCEEEVGHKLSAGCFRGLGGYFRG